MLEIIMNPSERKILPSLFKVREKTNKYGIKANDALTSTSIFIKFIGS